MSRPFNPCLVIPVYNHAEPLRSIVAHLTASALPCLLIDDGSDDACAQVVVELAAAHTWIEALRLPHNQGKGGAVKAGLLRAEQLGFSHAVQVDADGQHDLDDLPALLAAAQNAPDSMVIGRPLFDASMPKLRYYARYLTQAWVCINTLSCRIPDAMCGFRVYPVAALAALIRQVELEDRMAFDVEVLVRLDWAGVPILALPTRVRYPQDGLSHFRPWEDNLRISLTHARLFLGMLRRLPTLLMRYTS